MNIDVPGARLASLKRYISLLQQEEQRLTWVKASVAASEHERLTAESSPRQTGDKIAKAKTGMKILEGR